MGWLRRILGIETSEAVVEEARSSDVDIAELKTWFEKEAARSFSGSKEQISDKLESMTQQLEILKERLDALKEAELQNDNIPQREFDIMDGNRTSYINTHKQFIHRIMIPAEVTQETTAEFCSEYDEALHWLAKSTTKSSYVLSHFFANETTEVNKTVKELTDSVVKVKEVMQDQRVDQMGLARKAIMDVTGKSKISGEVEQERGILTKKLSNSEIMIEKLEKSVEKLKNSEAFANSKTLHQRKEDLGKEQKQLESDVEHVFAQIDKALRKYERNCVENIDVLKEYIADPVEALMDDADLVILQVLARIQDTIGSLDLKDSEKIVQRIGLITKSFLEGTRSRVVELKRSIRKLETEARKIDVIRELDDLRYKMEHAQNQVQLLNDKLAKLDRQSEKISIEDLAKEAQERIGEALDIEVKIKWTQEEQPCSS